MQLGNLEQNLSHQFKNSDLLKEALTHRSYLNEVPDWGLPHNERLEFLGDAVLELAVTEALYHRYPAYTEGQLTPIRAALVNYQMLAAIAREIDLEQFILLSAWRINKTAVEMIPQFMLILSRICGKEKLLLTARQFRKMVCGRFETLSSHPTLDFATLLK